MFFKNLICRLLVFVIFLNSGPVVIASEIIVDSSSASNHHALVDSAHNGTAIINISGNLSEDGLSHNKFSHFNIDSNGVVLNNSTEFGISQLTQSLLYNNPLLSSGSARVILNEVTGGNISELHGSTEIFGQKADYIFANPQGVICDGCGFINTDRLTMVTGSAENIDGKLDHFKIGSGIISIGASGLDASLVSAADLVSKSVKLDGAVNVKDNLAIKTGDNKYNYLTGEISSTSNADADMSVNYAVDAANFGSMYAGKITIIASQDGFGVKSDATMYSNISDLEITANGEIQVKDIISEAGVSLDSSSDISVTGSVDAVSDITIESNDFALNSVGGLVGNNVSIFTSEDLDISGTLYSYNDISFSSDNIFINNTGKIIQDNDAISDIFLRSSSNFSNFGEIYAKNKLAILSDGTIANSGSIEAIRSLDILGYDVTNNGDISSILNLYVNSSSNLKNMGILSSYGVVELISNNTLNNTNSIVSSEDLFITAKNYQNRCASAITGGTLFIHSDNLDNDSGQIIALKDAIFNIDTINNSNNIGKFVPHDSDIDAGIIISGDFVANTQKFNNDSGNLVVDGVLDIDNLDNNNGYIYSGSGGLIDNLAQDNFINKGEISIGNASLLNIVAKDLKIADGDTGMSSSGGAIFF